MVGAEGSVTIREPSPVWVSELTASMDSLAYRAGFHAADDDRLGASGVMAHSFSIELKCRYTATLDDVPPLPAAFVHIKEAAEPPVPVPVLPV